MYSCMISHNQINCPTLIDKYLDLIPPQTKCMRLSIKHSNLKICTLKVKKYTHTDITIFKITTASDKLAKENIESKCVKNFVAIFNLPSLACFCGVRYFDADDLALCYATNKTVKNIIRLLSLIYFSEKQFITVIPLIFRFDKV